RLDRIATDHFADGALRCDFHGPLGIEDVECVGLRVPDVPKDGGVGLHDVFIACQHLAGNAAADLDLIDLGDFGQDHGFDRVRQVVVQAGVGGTHPPAELQHQTDLIRLHLVDAAGHPTDDSQQHDYRKHLMADTRHVREHSQAGASQRDDVIKRTSGTLYAWRTVCGIV